MENVSRKKDIEELDYSTKDAQILLREFVALLHEVSTNYEMTIIRLENDHRREIDKLKTPFIMVKIRKLVKSTAKFGFRLAKKVADVLGIKDSLKKSRLYKKLYSSGVVDKLRGRV